MTQKNYSRKKTLANYQRAVKFQKNRMSPIQFKGFLLGLKATTNNKKIHKWLNKQG